MALRGFRYMEVHLHRTELLNETAMQRSDGLAHRYAVRHGATLGQPAVFSAAERFSQRPENDLHREATSFDTTNPGPIRPAEPAHEPVPSGNECKARFAENDL